MLDKLIKRMLKDVDMAELEQMGKRLRQDQAYASYDINLYASGFLDGWFDRPSIGSRR